MKKILIFLFIISVQFYFSQEEIDVKFYTEKQSNSSKIFADNNEFYPVSVVFEFTLVNMKSSLENNKVVVIPARTTKFYIAEIVRIENTKAASYQYNNKYDIGDASIKNYNLDYVYELPFEKGQTKLIYQGYNGNFSHQGKFAIDFDHKVGEKVFAAREGKVVDIQEKNTQNCPKIECAKYNNKIIIMHNDGSFAEYLHLKFNGVEVNVGDDVKKGQFIGYSGNTGYSKGAHLHFSVFGNENGEKKTIKTKFKTSTSEGEYLQEKKSYTKN